MLQAASLMEKESPKCINKSLSNRLKPLHRKTTDTLTSDAGLYLLIRIQACSCASFLFLLFFSTWVVMDGRNTIWVCRTPLEVAFEGFVHFSAEAKVLLLVSLSNLFCLVRFCFYQESEEAGLEKHQSQCFFTCIFSLSVLSRMLFLCLCDWLRTWKVWLWQC
jgi:hypothetical protein